MTATERREALAAAAERRQRILRGLLPATGKEIAEAYPGWWGGGHKNQRRSDLEAIGAVRDGVTWREGGAEDAAKG